MSNQRTRFTVLLSEPHLPVEEAIAFLSPRIGRYFAGGSIAQVHGIWSADGDHTRPHYQDGQCEPALRLQFSVLTDQEEQALTQLHAIIAQLKAELALDIHWVHVETERVTAHHFKLQP